MLEEIDSKRLPTKQLKYYYAMCSSLYGLVAGYSSTLKERENIIRLLQAIGIRYSLCILLIRNFIIG